MHGSILPVPSRSLPITRAQALRGSPSTATNTMLGSPNVPHNKSHLNASELDADLWLDRARDLCGHREALVTQLRSLGMQLQTASGEEAALLRPKSHGLLRELREAACHVCEAAQQYRDAARDPGAPLHYEEADYLEKMTHDLDFMGESEHLVAAIGTPRRLLRNNPLMLPRSLRAAELEATDAPPKNAEQARLRRAEALLVGAAQARRNPRAPSTIEALIEERADALDILSPPQNHYGTTRASPQHPERVFNRPLPGEEVGLRPPPDAAPPSRERTPEAPKPTFANKAPAVNDDWVREAHAQLEALREANANLPLERGDPELAALNHNPALDKFRPVRVRVVLFIKMAWGRRVPTLRFAFRAGIGAEEGPPDGRPEEEEHPQHRGRLRRPRRAELRAAAAAPEGKPAPEPARGPARPASAARRAPTPRHHAERPAAGPQENENTEVAAAPGRHVGPG